MGFLAFALIVAMAIGALFLFIVLLIGLPIGLVLGGVMAAQSGHPIWGLLFIVAGLAMAYEVWIGFRRYRAHEDAQLRDVLEYMGG